MTRDLHEGPGGSVKKYHARLSEQLFTMDMWTDILRKTLVVGTISFTVWIGCTLLRFLVGVATGWLFETAEKYSAVHAFLGVGFILTVMFLVGIVRGLLMLRPAWKDAEGDGVDKALVSFHQTYVGDEDDPKARYAEPTFLGAIRKWVMTASTIKSGGSAGMLIPSMYMGALVGAAGYYMLGEMGLYAGPTVAVFVATGIAAALTSVAGVPLASIAFVVEVFGSEYTPAAAIACAICLRQTAVSVCTFNRI